LAAVAAFLRALADHVERDAAFGAHVRALVVASGLIGQPRTVGTRRKSTNARGGLARAATVEGPLALDPFDLMRAEGEDQLRARLDEVDAAALHRIIRAHRLDPARLSVRWSDRERLIALIMDQVRARADHGKAFARV
jgi:hypothetical protein